MPAAHAPRRAAATGVPPRPQTPPRHSCCRLSVLHLALNPAPRARAPGSTEPTRAHHPARLFVAPVCDDGPAPPPMHLAGARCMGGTPPGFGSHVSCVPRSAAVLLLIACGAFIQHLQPRILSPLPVGCWPGGGRTHHWPHLAGVAPCASPGGRGDVAGPPRLGGQRPMYSSFRTNYSLAGPGHAPKSARRPVTHCNGPGLHAGGAGWRRQAA
jgi:hypothetical protein